MFFVQGLSVAGELVSAVRAAGPCLRSSSKTIHRDSPSSHCRGPSATVDALCLAKVLGRRCRDAKLIYLRCYRTQTIMACMRWDMPRATHQHQCLPWTAASAICTHRQLHRLVQSAYQPSQQLSHSSSVHGLASSGTDLLPTAAQQLQQAPHTCRPLASSIHDSSASGRLPVCYSAVLSSNEATKTAVPGSDRPSTSGPGSSGDNGDDPFNANFGEAVLVLREDLPLVFQQDMRYHIYREDITFRTPSMAYLTGLWKYQLLHRGARLLGNLLYSDVRVTLARVWQPALDKKQLKVHWCVSGHPRLSLFLKDMPLSTEVISTYFFDSKGRIYEHQVDQLIPPESLPVKFLEWLVGRLQPRAIPQPQLPIPGA